MSEPIDHPGRCDGPCFVCDIYDELFPQFAGTGGKCPAPLEYDRLEDT